MLKKIRFDIIRTRNLWFAFSILVIIPGLISILVQKLNYGVDFTGGRIIQFAADRKITTDEVERVIGRFDIKHNPVQLLSGDREFIVRTVDYSDPTEAKAFNEKIRLFKIALNVELHKIDPDKFVLSGLGGKLEQDRLDRALGKIGKKGYAPGAVLVVGNEEIPADKEGAEPTYNVTLQFKGVTDEKDIKKIATELYKRFDGYRQFSKEDKVDPIFGIELKKKAILALIVASIGILIYVTVRFEFWYAVAAVLALVHDGFVTIGFFSLARLEVNSAFVAIILTVFGYSINDTIIIFDRIRENLRKDKKMPLGKLMNQSLWETMARSINTVLTVEMTIVAILIFGGNSIYDFALGMCVGITSGCYSSIFVAAPLAYVFKRKQAGREEAVAPAARTAKKPAAPTSPRESAAPDRAVRKTDREASPAAPGGKPQGGPAAGDGDKGGKKKGKGKQRRR